MATVFAETDFGIESGTPLSSVLAAFSPPASLSEFLEPAMFEKARHDSRVAQVLWLLKRQQLIQV